MLRNEDEDELKEILSSTFTNNNYIDEEIQSLLITHEEPMLRPLESADSQRSSETSQNHYFRDGYVSHFNQEQYHLGELQQAEKVVEKTVFTVPKTIHIFDQFYQTINRSLRSETLEEVRHKYPLFLLSQPSYEIANHIKQLSLSYSGGLLKKNVLVMDAGYCEQQKVFKIAVGTDEGTVVIFEPNSSKPQKVIECFNRICMITSVRWSKNMQYLAIANDEKELFVYSFKQAIYIENQISYRILKTPVEYCYLGEKQLKNIVIDLYYVEEIPFQMLLVTEKNEILKLEMKKHIINFRPQITTFPHKIQNFLDLRLHKIRDASGGQGVVMAVSGYEAVTVCLVDPFFEVIMVYDKERHGGHFKKFGYPQVSFRDNPCSMMVVWDKYLQILNLKVDSYSPFQYSFSITHKELLPDSTIIAGFLSNSLIYQVTRVGVKIHSVSKFSDEVSRKYESKEVLLHRLNYSSFCYGEKIEQSMSSNSMQIEDLRYLKGLFSVSKRTLFISTNRSIEMIYFTTVQQYASSLVQNNNWKTALQILKNCYLGCIYNLDELQEDIITAKIKQYSMRYINFLETVILSDMGQSSTTQSNIMLLWNQQLIFIFNILLVTHLQAFLVEQILLKIYKLNPNYLSNIIPFILTNRITRIHYESLQILIGALPKEYVSKLVFNLLPSNNESELPHQINNLLIRQQMYLQLVDLNQKFKDHYTSMAVLVGIYLKLEHDNERNIMELTEQKRKIGKLIAYAVHDSLYSVNLNKYSKHQNKQIFQSLIPLLLQQILQILVKQEPVGLFELILQELYMGNCLQTLNELQVIQGDGDIMRKIVDSIPYQQVVEFKCQKRYWIAVLKLYSRKIIDVKIYAGLHYLCVEDYVQIEYIQKFVSKCYELIVRQFNDISIPTLSHFFDELLSSKHISMIKLVGRMLRRYQQILAAMFQEQSQRDVKIYEFLDECLPLVDTHALQEIKLLLKENIKLLTYIDANRASDIICKYFLTDLNLFIDDLEGYNSQQMKLIHSVLQLYNYKQSLYSLKIKYLELLAKRVQYHDIILSELTKQNYPLDESLEICRKYDVLQAYAYLLVKCGGSGNTETAIKVYFKIIWKRIYEIGVNHNHEHKQELQRIILKYLKISIKTCMDLNLMSHQSQWFVIMEELEVLKKNIFKNFYFNSHYCEILRTIINKEAYPELVRTLITEISYQNVILYLRTKMVYFDLEALQILVDEIAKNSIYEIRMYHIFGDSFSNTENELRKALLNSELKGFATNDTCNICEERGGLLVHYNCGHQLHPACGQDVRQCVICKDVVEVIYQKRIDSSLKIKTEIYSGGLPENLDEVVQQIEKETRLKRMSYFDELNQLYSIQR